MRPHNRSPQPTGVMSRKRSRPTLKSLVLIGVGVFIASALVGIFSTGQSPEGIIDTFYDAPPDPAYYARQKAYLPGEEEMDMVEWEYKRMRTLERVSKITEEGVIHRINEPRRQLFINDPVWIVMPEDRQEHVARVVADYLDVVNNEPTGMVTVHSYRDGQRLAAINRGGTFSMFK